jgi:hypothetical protein
MSKTKDVAPDNTAARVALWRAFVNISSIWGSAAVGGAHAYTPPKAPFAT